MLKRHGKAPKLKQKGMERLKTAKKSYKKRTPKAPWSDPLKTISRGGFGR